MKTHLTKGGLKHSGWCWLVLIFAMGMLGCDKTQPGEEMQSLVLEMPSFGKVEVRDVFEVELVQDGTWGVEIVASARAMDYMDVHLEGETLVLDRTRKGDYRHPKTGTPTAYVHFDSLSLIATLETCHIKSQHAITGGEIGIVDYSRMIEVDLELDVQSFYFWNTPNASIYRLSGKSESLKLWNIGLSSVDAAQLECRYALVENRSQGDCRVRPSEKLEYRLTSTGNIVYFGEPQELVALEVDGPGRLIKGD